jgi:hypothetical protein
MTSLDPPDAKYPIHTPIDFMDDAERCLIDGGMFGKRFRALRSLNVFVLFLGRILRRGLASA